MDAQKCNSAGEQPAPAAAPEHSGDGEQQRPLLSLSGKAASLGRPRRSRTWIFRTQTPTSICMQRARGFGGGAKKGAGVAAAGVVSSNAASGARRAGGSAKRCARGMRCAVRTPAAGGPSGKSPCTPPLTQRKARRLDGASRGCPPRSLSPQRIQHPPPQTPSQRTQHSQHTQNAQSPAAAMPRSRAACSTSRATRAPPTCSSTAPAASRASCCARPGCARRCSSRATRRR